MKTAYFNISTNSCSLPPFPAQTSAGSAPGCGRAAGGNNIWSFTAGRMRSFLFGSVQRPAALNFDFERRIIAPKIDLYRLQYFSHHIMLLPTVSFYSLRQMT